MLFVVNPASARGRTLELWNSFRGNLARLGLSDKCHITSRPGEAVEVTRDALKCGEDCVVAVGGDGTLNEILNGYLDQSGGPLVHNARLGVLPLGTGADFSRSLGIPSGAASLEVAGRMLVRGRSRQVDAVEMTFVNEAGRNQSRFMINAATVGLGGEAVHQVNAWRNTWPRWVGGRMRYIAASAIALNRYRNVELRVLLDEHREMTIQSNLVVVANGKFAGSGMMLAPEAEIDDGLLDVILTEGATRLDVLRELPRVGRGRHMRNPRVRQARARTVKIDSTEHLRLELDGDAAGFTPARLSVLPGVVRFVV